MKPALFLLFLFLGSRTATAQTTWYVRAGASPAGADGASWATATPSLHDALEAAQSGDAVWVAQGTYKPSAAIDRYATFILKDGVQLFGGFAGTETALAQRDWQTHPAILSGDIGVPGDSTDNSYSILYASRTSVQTRVDGFVFEFGSASHPDNSGVFFFERGHSGSAIYLNGQNPDNFAYLTIENCVFRRNWSDYFGAVYANGRNSGKSAVIMSGCTFTENRCAGAGGGLVIDNDTDQQQPALIQWTDFRRNSASNRGGGMLLSHHGDVTVLHCTFVGDSILFPYGGALSIEGDYLTAKYRFENCLFDQNKAFSLAAGVALSINQAYSKLDLLFRNCTFSRHKGQDLIYFISLNGTQNTLFQNCLFRENTVANLIYLDPIGETGSMDFLNCLFYKTSGAEMNNFSGSLNAIDLRMKNCIVVKAPGTIIKSGGANLYIDHCMVSHNKCPDLGSGVVCGDSLYFGGTPKFENPDSGDFHLQPCSPAVNAGDNAAVLAAGLAADFDGRPRVLDGIVDLGPYEQNLGFEPAAVTPASCPDARDGAVYFAGALCPPVQIAWTMGAESGARTDSLAPGTYVFSFTDGAGHALQDTIAVPALPPMQLLPNVAPPLCFGQASGVAGVDVSGGTPPYQIGWPGGNTGAYLFNVPAGAYPVTVTDDKGCTSAAVIEVPAAEMLQAFYTVTPASGPAQADGQFRIDSVRGCTGVFQWPGPAQANLPPGTYFVTVTDPCGCSLVLPVTVGFVSAAGETAAGLSFARIAPNPGRAGRAALLHWVSATPVETVRVQDALGRVVWQSAAVPTAGPLEIPAPAPAGVYWISLLAADGRGKALRWVLQ